MKKYVLGFLLGVGALLALGVALTVSQPSYTAQQAPTAGSGVFGLESRDTSGDNNATTTVTYLTSTDAASSTLAFKAEGAESIDLNLIFKASTTASKLTWRVEWAHGSGSTNCVSTPDLCDWHGEDVATVDSGLSITHGSTTPMHAWTPAVTTLARKNVTITPVASRYGRINFGSMAANGGLWAQVVLKKPY